MEIVTNPPVPPQHSILEQMFTGPKAPMTEEVPFNNNITVTNISFLLLVLLNTLQLATGATGPFSQGVTAVVHGCSVHVQQGGNRGVSFLF